MFSTFSEQDQNFMTLALEEAELGMQAGNYPCGAVLVVDNEIVSKSHNIKEANQDRVSHAEMLLYIQNSKILKKAKKNGSVITMYTTLEPCLMCFGAAAIHRVDRIVASSPDPYGNMSQIEGGKLGSFYAENLPKIEYGLCFKETYAMTVAFLQQKDNADSQELVKLLTEIRNRESK